jgi:hypothetical protein
MCLQEMGHWEMASLSCQVASVVIHNIISDFSNVVLFYYITAHIHLYHAFISTL